MAQTRRIQFTTLSDNGSFQSVVQKSSAKEDTVAALPVTKHQLSAETQDTARIELILFMPDDRRCPEFCYPELIKQKKDLSKTLDELEEDKERDELEALARKFEEKYGGAKTRKKDRLQDLVDLGYGYDETDSFIDNSEAYDELVPASLTTKYGGFYINCGTLQFRQVSDEEDENDKECFEENKKPKKRKMKENGEIHPNKKKKRRDDIQFKSNDLKNRAFPENPDEKMPLKKKKKTKTMKAPDLANMLKKFHKEKLQQLQTLAEKGPGAVPLVNHDCMEPSEDTSQTNFEGSSVDPLLTLIASANDDDLAQAASVAELAFDVDGLLDEPPNASASEPDESGEPMEVDKPKMNPPPLPDGLPPAEDTQLQELCLDVHLRESLQRLKNAIGSVMPEQIARFHDNCQAHSEARAAKLVEEEKGREQRTLEGSDEEEEEKSGKRVFGPRKRFRWNEEIRDCLCEVAKLKMEDYELKGFKSPNMEEYLRAFLEAEVKPLWPKGWMQSRILLIESRRIHSHITGIVARKKTMNIRKSQKGPNGGSERRSVSTVHPQTLAANIGGSAQLLGKSLSSDWTLHHPLSTSEGLPANLTCPNGEMRGELSLEAFGSLAENGPSTQAAFENGQSFRGTGKDLEPSADLLQKVVSGASQANLKCLSLHTAGSQCPSPDTTASVLQSKTHHGGHPDAAVRNKLLGLCSDTQTCLYGTQQASLQQRKEVTTEASLTLHSLSSASCLSIGKPVPVGDAKKKPLSSGQMKCLTKERNGEAPTLSSSAHKQTSNSGLGSDLKPHRTGGKKAQKLTLVAPPGGTHGDGGFAVQGVARLLTTSLGDAPVSTAMAATEDSCRELPKPTLSLLSASYPDLEQTLDPRALKVLPGLDSLQAFAFSGLAFTSKPPRHSQACQDALVSGPASGTFQYGLRYDGSQIHAEGPNAQRKLQ